MSKVKTIIKLFLIFLICLIICSINWAFIAYDKVTFEEVLFHLNLNLTKSGIKILFDFFVKGFIPTIVLFSLILYLFRFNHNLINGYELYFKIKFCKKNFTFKFNELMSQYIINIPVYLFLIILLLLSLFKLEFFDYIKSQIQRSNFIEKNYVNPKNVKLEFPDKKRNLIYIFVESLESSYFNSDVMVVKEENVLGNLKDLTDNNIYFSNSNGYGGAIQVNYLGWTTAGMVAQTAGIPLKIPGSISNETQLKTLVPGSYSIGDILEKRGYNQMLMLGSDADFGNRKVYFRTHGNYTIYDLSYARKIKKISKNYYKWWGFEDSKLFKFAKEEILKLASDDKPFNFTLLTANTHFPEGLTEDVCENNFDVLYSNSISCSASQIDEFVDWIKKQDFYDNTTIVISGDHLTMQAGYFYDTPESDKRNVYNLFVNSAIETNNSRNRLFTTMDLYPTTLAAMGVKIDGDKLGLGVNLFSEKKTIVEKYGRKKVDDEISKVSKFYNNKILK